MVETKTIKLHFFGILVFVCGMLNNALAQPANDNCTNASNIVIPQDGYGLGLLTGSTVDISSATIQTDETFATAILVSGLNRKSVWYKFTIASTRAVLISLKQPDSEIQAGNVGFAVYKAATCLPTNAQLSTKLSPIERFGDTYHPCVDSGTYYIQVSANLNANGPIFVTVDVANPLPAVYDLTSNPHRIGTLGTQRSIRTDFEVECQGIEAIDENCLPNTSFRGFTKSTWHTFTTPAFFDYVAFFLSNLNSVWNGPEYTVGFRMFEGNVETADWRSLSAVIACDSFRTNGYYPDRKTFKCGQLKPNTTYSIQLLYHKDFTRNMRLATLWDGRRNTAGPLPVSTLAVSNKMGFLNASKNGVNNFAYDTFACNSIHVPGCGPAMPVEGVVGPNNWRYNMSMFFTFSLESATSLQFYVTNSNCGSVNPLVRVFKQSPGATCNALNMDNLLTSFVYSGQLKCLEPGEYIIQVMGSDSLRIKNFYTFGNLPTSNNPQCIFNQLSSGARVQIVAQTEIPTNLFSLSEPGRAEVVNPNGSGIRQPLIPATQYILTTDTFGCANTVMPNDPNLCNEKEKAVYRILEVADSGVLYHNSVTRFNFKLYKGDANALATAQNVHAYPQTIDGLTPFSKCAYFTSSIVNRNMCVTPGTYTLVNFGNNNMIGDLVNHRITLRKIESKYADPSRPNNLGSIIDSIAKYGGNRIFSDWDTFSCRLNSTTIDNLAPCVVSGRQSGKLLYREFFLTDPSRLEIQVWNGDGTNRLFRGRVSEGLETLRGMPSPWNCFTYATTGNNQCSTLDEGWYTIVTYGDDVSYEIPEGNSTSSSHNTITGLPNRLALTITPACQRPKFNRPAKASVTAAGQPHNVDWVEQGNSSPAYPIFTTTHNLPVDYFDCTNDTPFVSHPVLACAPTATGNNQITKVSYHVWEITKESFITITLPAGMWGTVFGFDVRTEAEKLITETPVQECLERPGYIQLCRMQPGVYTLVVFGRTNMICNTVNPVFYVDNVGTSRFDHANNAFDFGALLPDNTARYGKPGQTNPLHPNRQPSNDFFYCTTGSQERDPTNAACLVDYYATINNPQNNNPVFPTQGSLPANNRIARRNLWYTFTVNDPGTVFIRVENKTPGKPHQYNFAVFRSDVDGTLDFDEVKLRGEVDSTTAQGLTYVANNLTGFYCYANQQISIYNEPCNFKPTRFYVLVENRNPYWAANIHTMNPNSQVEVSLRLDSVMVIQPKFDFYSNAGIIQTDGAGKFTGETDNFTCATRNLTDPVAGTLNACQKTLWYKFTTTVSGNIRYRVVYNSTNYSTPNQVQLFRQVKENDSTASGLQYLLHTATQTISGVSWMRRCISPGTYYLLLPGCNASNEFVYPEIEILEQEGDFCATPLTTGLDGPGTKVVPVIIDCHTIGTDYGEFNPTLTCPEGGETVKYKTTWFRLDVGGNDTLDITVYIDEKTNAHPSEIKYRMMTGTCAAMQEQSCVQDALTRNTYRCLAPGNSYYIQVFTPVQLTTNPFPQVTGSIELNISAEKHVDVCNPADPCIAVANFIPQFDCTKDRFASFQNISTYGTSISYEWDFGHNNAKSNQVSPMYFYPALTTDQTYKVQLIVTNNECGKKDTIEHNIFIPARPAVDLGPDINNCVAGTSVTLDATSHPGSTYRWSTNSLLPTATFNNTSTRWVQVTYNNCIARDTINIWNNPITKRALQVRALCTTDEVNLNANRGSGEQYIWSTEGVLGNINVTLPGYYWVDLYLNQCIVRDSFLVVSRDERPLGEDTTVCQKDMPIEKDATIPGVTTYRWQNNATNPIQTITQPGIYWVDITAAGCTFRDSLIIYVDSLTVLDTAKITICAGDIYELPSGEKINKPGIYSDTLQSINGCDSLVVHIDLSIEGFQTEEINDIFCSGQGYFLPSGREVSLGGVYSDTLVDAGGCGSTIYTINLTELVAQQQVINANLCQGESFTSPSGKVFANEGAYADTLRFLSGCDSIIYTIILGVGNVSEQIIDTTICQGATYILSNNQTIGIEGTYRDTLRYASGCDSIINIINLKVQTATTNSISETICANATFVLPSGRSVSIANTYYDTLRYNTGCDSVRYTVELKVVQPSVTSRDTSFCSGENIRLPSGRLVAVAGIYEDTLRGVTGCDSLIGTWNVNEFTAITQSQNVRICLGSNHTLPSGRLVSSSGIFRDTIRYAFGCDSLITIATVDVSNLLRETTTSSICTGQTYLLPSGRAVGVQGVYRDTIRYANTVCDSLITTLTLQVVSSVTNNISQAICPGENIVLPSGRVVSSEGTHRDTLRSVAGCDSLITVLSISYKTATNQTLSANICLGETYRLPSGRFVAAAGRYNDTLRFVRGCDSIHFIVDIAIRQPTVINEQQLLCVGQNYTLPGGRVVSLPGVYRDTLTSVASGCDSIIITEITNRPPLTVSISGPPNVCIGSVANLTAQASGGNGGPYTFVWEGFPSQTSSISPTITANRTFTVQVTDGCTEVAATSNFNVAALPLPMVLAGRDTTVAAGVPFVLRPQYSADVTTVNWSPTDFLSCSNCQNPVATVSEPINYTVEVQNAAGCKSSGARQIDLLCNSESIFLPNTFTPNGDGVNDVWYPRGTGIRTVRYLKVFNRWGQVVFERTNFYADDRSAAWDGTFKGQPLAPDVFVYSMGYTCSSGQHVDTKGNVMIVR